MKNKMNLPSRQRTPVEEREYCRKAAIRIVKLCEPAKNLGIPRLMGLKAEQLEKIGKAARELYDVLEANGFRNMKF